MESDLQFALHFRNWRVDGDVVETSSATADLFERVWSQVQNFQEGSVAQITATTMTMVNYIGREHSLDIDQMEMVSLIHDRIQYTKSF
tara:strand:+ start:4374 stop:4637 length:264 start_codon:yes stop_codon:yes gene_type:complete